MKKSFSFCTDSQLRISSWGKTIIEFAGRSPDDVLGKKYYEVLPRIYSKNKDAVSLSLREKKKLSLKDYQFNCFNGYIRTDIHISPRFSTNGKIKGSKVVIAPHAPCPLFIKTHNSQQLIDIGKIASTFAHGVRNHLNVIKGGVEWLNQKYAKESSLIEFTTIIKEEISKLDLFISRFLSTSLSNAVPAETDINFLMKKIEMFTSLQAHSKKITAYYDYNNKVPFVMVDAIHLEQAILNVLNNAMEAMQKGGKLVVRICSENHEGTVFSVIEVADTGKGIKEKEMKSLEIPLNNNSRGRGFGLFITREIMHFYGGHIEIKSRKGAGTTVRLLLPALRNK